MNKQSTKSTEKNLSRHPITTWQRIALGLLVGLIVGVLSFLAQGRLPGDWSILGNSGAVWLVFAFLTGAMLPGNTWAAVSGVVTLGGALIGYFAAGALMDVAYAPVMVIYWAIIAVIGGPVFGIAGHQWWSGKRLRNRTIAAALLGAVVIAEGQYHIRYNPHLSVGWPMVVVGLIMPLLLGRSAKDRLYTYLALIPTSLLGVAAYEGLTWFDWLRANFF
jgi:ElaB/YqjD/DUF883 family membrane-anchored ribosome-binding protein